MASPMNFRLPRQLKKGEPLAGLSLFFKAKSLFKDTLIFLLLIIPAVLCLPVFPAKKDRVIEKLIPVVEVLSSENQDDPNYYFNSPAQLEILNDKVFVLDPYNHRIQIFDPEGNYLRTIGKKGKGPGEFNAPEGFYLDSQNQRIYVADTRNLRLQVIDFEGKAATVVKLTFAPTRVTLNNNEILITAFPGTSLILKKEPLIKVFDLTGNHRGGFFTPIRTDDMVLNILANSLLLKKDRQGNLVCAHQYCLNKVQIFNTKDKLIKEFKIIYKAESFTTSRLDLSIQSDSDIQKIAFFAADLAFDSKNNYYFLSGVNGQLPNGELEKGREIYKYDPAGNYLGTIILPVAAKLIAFDSSDNLYLIDRDYVLRKYKFSQRK
jgi:hypothetical protein